MLGSGWCRVTGSATLGGSDTVAVPGFLPANANGSFTRTLGGVISVWGAQLEVGSFATSYIPTVGSVVTRSADTFSLPLPAAWFVATQGTFLESYSQISPA